MVYVGSMGRFVFLPKKGVRSLCCVAPKVFVGLMEKSALQPTRGARSQNAVWKTDYVDIFLVPKIMKPLMEHVYEVVPDVKSRKYAKKMGFVDSTTDCV
jgi:hypothetical protein